MEVWNYNNSYCICSRANNSIVMSKDEVKGKGLYEQMEETPTKIYNSFTREDFDKYIEQCKESFKQRDIHKTKMMIGIEFAKSLDDDMFISVVEACEVMCNMETAEYIEDRYNKLVKHGE